MLTTLLMTTLLSLAQAQASAATEAEWLSRLRLPKLFNASSEPKFTDEDLHIQYFDLGFPASGEAMIRDAEERFKAGERSARLLHQSAQAYGKQGDVERAWKELHACLKAYDRELEEDGSNYELRLYSAHAYEQAAKLSWNQDLFEAMQEQFLAAAELQPEAPMPWVLSARAQWQRWMLGKARGLEASEWLDDGIRYAQKAVQVAPSEAGGLWWRFLLKMWKLMFASPELEVEARRSHLKEFAEELLLGCENVHDADRLRFAAHYYSAAIKIGAIALDRSETDKEGTMAAAGRHIASMLDLVHAFEGELNVTAGAALLCWSHRCMTDAGSDWAEFFKRMQDLGLETEVGLGVACYIYHQRGQAEVAAGFADLLEALPKTDNGRAALVAYCYVSGDWKRGLACAQSYDVKTLQTETQCAVLRLRAGHREESLGQLEALAAEEGVTDGYVMHALGVARALAGELDAAVLALEAALHGLEIKDGAEATLAEVSELLSAGR